MYNAVDPPLLKRHVKMRAGNRGVACFQGEPRPEATLSPLGALTIRQPWVCLIIAGDKDVENRSWKINYRGQSSFYTLASGTTKSGVRNRTFPTGVSGNSVSRCDLPSSSRCPDRRRSATARSCDDHPRDSAFEIRPRRAGRNVRHRGRAESRDVICVRFGFQLDVLSASSIRWMMSK
jgi:hypothetical protein